VCFLLSAREPWQGEKDSHRVAWWLMVGWEVFVVDIRYTPVIALG